MTSLRKFIIRGFTLVELLIALAITAILGSLILSNGVEAMEKRRFTELQEVASRLAIAQQAHILVFNQYASALQKDGKPTKDKLTFTEADQFNITVLDTSITGFTAEIKTLTTEPQPSDNCFAVRLSVEKGFSTFTAYSRTGQNTTSSCLPNA